MNPLQYTSEEMFSSTELIRKSKKVFDKLQNNEIEKAIILRDGKPSFLILDFSSYEDLMSEYLSLKSILENTNNNASNIQNNDQAKNNIPINNKKEDIYDNSSENDELQNALKQIDELNLEAFAKYQNSDVSKHNNIEKKDNEEKQEPLKEFWE